MKKQMKLSPGGKKWYEWNRFFSVVFLVCTMFNFVPATGQKSAKPMLYKVNYASKDFTQTPYRIKTNEPVVGEVLRSQVYEVLAVEGDWLKIKLRHGEYYLYKSRLDKVDKPDVVASPWAKEWFAYNDAYIGTAGEWGEVADDWTKPVTRAEMAEFLVHDIMENIYGNWVVKFSLKGVVEAPVQGFFTDTDSFYAGRLAYWGIVPGGKFNPQGKVTYGEMTNLVFKLMEYDSKRDNRSSRLTKADIAAFGIGGDKNPNALCTKEQARMLCDKVLIWNHDQERVTGAKYEATANVKYGGTVSMCDGTFTIKTMLGKKPNQPHLFVNAAGKVELSNSQKQQFRITYKKTALNMNRQPMSLFTIQTMDGRYLGIAGTPVNGSRLIAQKEEFLWWLEHGPSEDYQYTTFMEVPFNYHQIVNVSGWKTADGTPVITWFWRHGTGSDANNCKFIFSKVK